jgi:ATP-dependent protease Clp ATPase subunit
VDQVDHLIAAPSAGIYICGECIDQAADIVKEQREKAKAKGDDEKKT